MACSFKKRVKPRPLQRGDLVLRVLRGLVTDPRGKFRPNWCIPYIIRELTSEGAAWLMNLDGNCNTPNIFFKNDFFSWNLSFRCFKVYHEFIIIFRIFFPIKWKFRKIYPVRSNSEHL